MRQACPQQTNLLKHTSQNAEIQDEMSDVACTVNSQGLREGHCSCFHCKAKQQLICITDCACDKLLHNDARLEG